MTTVQHRSKAPPTPSQRVRTVTRNYERVRSRRSLTAGWGSAPKIALRFLSPIALLVLWQLSDSLNWVDPTTLPGPVAILDAYRELWAAGDLQAALPISLQRAGTGLLIGGTAGLVLGVIAGLSVSAERAYDAPLQMIRTIPFIALVPLFVVWFGIGETSKISLVIGASIFPVYLNTYHGIRGIDRKLLEVGRTFEMSRWETIRLVVVPLAMPGILVGWRYAAGAALLGLVAAEQINSQAGIGYILNTANQFQRTDIILAGILVYAVLGLGVDLVMRGLEFALLPWR
ncbi:MAG: transporter permease [Marmoricola sp.]|nr:transporter permease [Marmoricola sp.]